MHAYTYRNCPADTNITSLPPAGFTCKLTSISGENKARCKSFTHHSQPFY